MKRGTGVVRLGFSRGLIEARDYLRNWDEMSFNIVLVVGIGLVLWVINELARRRTA